MMTLLACLLLVVCAPLSSYSAVTYFGGRPQPAVPLQPAVPPHQPVYHHRSPIYQHHGYALDIDPPDYPYFGPPVHHYPPVYSPPHPQPYQAPGVRVTSPNVQNSRITAPVALPNHAASGVIQPAPAHVQAAPMHVPPVPAYMQPQGYGAPGPMYGGFVSPQRYYKERFSGLPCGPPPTPSPDFRAIQAEAFANTGRRPEFEPTFECDCRRRRKCQSPDVIKPQYADYCGGTKQKLALYNQFVCCCQYSQQRQ